jgi:hypothetical protein
MKLPLAAICAAFLFENRQWNVNCVRSGLLRSLKPALLHKLHALAGLVLYELNQFIYWPARVYTKVKGKQTESSWFFLFCGGTVGHAGMHSLLKSALSDRKKQTHQRASNINFPEVVQFSREI